MLGLKIGKTSHPFPPLEASPPANSGSLFHSLESEVPHAGCFWRVGKPLPRQEWATGHSQPVLVHQNIQVNTSKASEDSQFNPSSCPVRNGGLGGKNHPPLEAKLRVGSRSLLRGKAPISDFSLIPLSCLRIIKSRDRFLFLSVIIYVDECSFCGRGEAMGFPQTPHCSEAF